MTDTQHDLTGKTIAFVATNGVEQTELTSPWEAITNAGGTPVLISPEHGTITAMQGDWEHGASFNVDQHIGHADAKDYHALVLPGGTINSDQLRTNEDVLAVVRDFFDQSKPVSAICHAPWILINAGVVEGRTLTSVPTIAADMKNAGAQWVDEEVVVDSGLTTSRTPADLDAFNTKTVEEIAEGKHRDQTT